MTTSHRHLKQHYEIDTLFLEVPNMGTWTNVYALNGRNSVILVDTGSKVEANLARLSQYLATKRKDVYLLLTHEHTDHVGLARAVQKRYGAAVFIHRKALRWTESFEKEWDRRSENARTMLRMSGFAGGDVARLDEFDRVRVYAESFRADHYVAHGETLRVGGREFEVIHTPGHSEGSVCYRDCEHGLLFCGDNVVGGSPAVPATIDCAPGRRSRVPSIKKSLGSLGTLEKRRNGAPLLPGHGAVVTDLEKYRNGYVGYIERCRRQVLRAIGDGRSSTPAALYERIYAGRPLKSPTHFFARIQQLFSVLDLLEHERSISRRDGNGATSYSAAGGDHR